MVNDIFVQVGVTALRSPTGEFLPAVPLYVKVDKLKESGLCAAEEKVLRDVSGVFMKKHQQFNEDKKKNKNGRKNQCQNINK